MDMQESILIPTPQTRVLNGKPELPLEVLHTWHAPDGWCPALQPILAEWRHYEVHLRFTAKSTADIRLEEQSGLGHEAWRMRVDSGGIRISAGNRAGALYAIGALEQMIRGAAVGGVRGGRIPGQEITDRPRWHWRGLMLDSARHKQSVATIRKLLDAMAQWRLNTLHWHLTDNQGWRLRLPSAPELNRIGDYNPGSFSGREISRIVEYARVRGITVVPEIDMPGHCGGLLRLHPEFACDPAHPGYEVCLANPEVRAFFRNILTETAALFPDAPVIHIGGDEANAEAWNRCPACRDAILRHGWDSVRRLEADFMMEMTREIVRLGRKPMLWCTMNEFPSDTIIQAWTGAADVAFLQTHTNPWVYSLHHDLYFDYPVAMDRHHAEWMPSLPPEKVCTTDPKQLCTPDGMARLLGLEACLWTEEVPSWRVMSQIRSRLPALAEVAWGNYAGSDYADLCRRQIRLGME